LSQCPIICFPGSSSTDQARFIDLGVTTRSSSRWSFVDLKVIAVIDSDDEILTLVGLVTAADNGLGGIANASNVRASVDLHTVLFYRPLEDPLPFFDVPLLIVLV
jgi:hypothetical protein